MFPDVKDVIRIRHVFFVGAVGVGDILRSLSQVNAVDLIVMCLSLLLSVIAVQELL